MAARPRVGGVVVVALVLLIMALALAEVVALEEKSLAVRWPQSSRHCYSNLLQRVRLLCCSTTMRRVSTASI